MKQYLLPATVVVALLAGFGQARASWSNWQYSESIDDFTDEKSLMIGVADERKGQAVLVACYLKDKQAVLFFQNGHIDLTMEDQRNIKWRFDAGDVFDTNFRSSDKGGAGTNDIREISSFVDGLIGGSEKVAISSDGTIMVIPLRGSTAAATKFKTGCPALN